jgi:hypothetical protein
LVATDYSGSWNKEKRYNLEDKDALYPASDYTRRSSRKQLATLLVLWKGSLASWTGLSAGTIMSGTADRKETMPTTISFKATLLNPIMSREAEDDE